MTSRTRLALATGCLSLAGTVPAAHAADWEFNPKVEAGALYDDNYRLAPDGSEVDVSGALADVELEFKRVTPVTEFTFTPRARATYFPDASDEESDDYFANLVFLRHAQRTEFALRADFAIEDIVSSEQPGTDIDSGLGEPGVGEGGRLTVRNRRDVISVRPFLSHELNERHQLQFGIRYVDVGFETDVPGLQVGYQDADATVGWAYDYSERSTLITRLRAARYEIDEGSQESNGYGAELEWGTETSQTIRSFVRVGAQRSDIVGPLGDEITETSWLAGAGLRWTAGLTELFLDATRTVGPTSSGFIVERDQLRARLDRAISPRFSVFAGVRGIRDGAVDPDSTYQGRDYATGDIGLQWRVLQQLSVIATVDYTWQEFRDEVTDATSLGAMLTLLYEPRRRD